MEPPRRFLKFLSAIFLAIGVLLLLYAAGTWYLAAQETAVFEASMSNSLPELVLPPALKPAALPGGAAGAKTAVEQPALEKTAAGEVPLLPESPLTEQNTAAAASTAEPSVFEDSRPLRIIIPALDIDAPVVAAGLQTKYEGDRAYQQWSVPNAFAAGWHDNSAQLGEMGNIVLNGHNNIHGAIFGELKDLAVGEQIVLMGANTAAVYRVAHHELLREQGLSLRERVQHASWIAPTADRRLTLVTCWPNTTNSHRLIVVALPEKGM
jgi:LPXTG-site transpeptidase (sortase) family protein